MEKYILENEMIYKLEGDFYNLIAHLPLHAERVSGNYAKVQYQYLLENKLEFLAELIDDDKFEDYFSSYQKEMAGKEEELVNKMQIKDENSKAMAREFLMYQSIS